MATATSEWIRERARPIASVSPDAANDDVQLLRHAVASAQVVGLGESTHGAHEQFALKDRIVRVLVTDFGFRSLALEEDWTKGLEIDRYIVSGQGNIRDIVAEAGIPWRTEEIVANVEWLRRYNETHRHDPVRFVGVDVVAVRAAAYDAVAEYVRHHAPARTGELKQHYDAIYPRGPIFEHIQWYRGAQDKQSLIAHARGVLELVQSLPETDGQALALQHARSVVAFYEYHSTSSVALRDQRMAENVISWQQQTGHKVIYWAANVHTAVAQRLTISFPPFPPATHATAGHALRQRYGAKYLSVGFVFDQGAVNAGFAPPTPHDVPPPQADFVETFLRDAGGHMNAFMLDLRGDLEGGSWLTTPAKTRVIGPAYDPKQDAAYSMAGGTLSEWFDLLVYQRTVTPTHQLPQPARPR
jgi:erythromycin esterase